MVKSLFLKLLSIPYSVVIFIRNKLFDIGLLSQKSFDVAVISVGNLSAGGTGKTPLIEWLLNELSVKYKVAVLSRGYKRKTKGFKIVDLNDTALSVGDEPLQIKNNYPKAVVSVCEKRVVGIENLLKQHADLDFILLDDAFQHRYVKPTYSILLTDKNKLFTNDTLLPHGSLRESRNSASRADAIVVTKCENDLTDSIRTEISNQIKKYSSANVYFSSLQYGDLFLVSNLKETSGISKKTVILCVTGIANAKPLLHQLQATYKEVKHLNFGDHFNYKASDLGRIINNFDNIANPDKAIITTQKDWMRLKSSIPEKILKRVPIYVQPVIGKLDNSSTKEILDLIESYVRKN